MFLSGANSTETEKMKQERFLKGRRCVEESLHELKAPGCKEMKLNCFQQVLSVFGPRAGMAVLTQG